MAGVNNSTGIILLQASAAIIDTARKPELCGLAAGYNGQHPQQHHAENFGRNSYVPTYVHTYC
jgi:hypothetical protein